MFNGEKMRGRILQSLLVSLPATERPIELRGCLQSTGTRVVPLSQPAGFTDAILAIQNYLCDADDVGPDLILVKTAGGSWQCWGGRWNDGIIPE